MLRVRKSNSQRFRSLGTLPFEVSITLNVYVSNSKPADQEKCNAHPSQLQPPTLPREDVNALGVKYRRIPILSIGRDIYCDTRLILDKLEERFPSGKLGASQPEQKAIEKLLEKWTVDGVFPRAAQLIPPALPMLNDSKFVQDRGEFTGRGWAKSAIAEARPEALAHMREFFQMLESTILADGRDWILKSEKPTLADIHSKQSCQAEAEHAVLTLDFGGAQLYGRSTGFRE